MLALFERNSEAIRRGILLITGNRSLSKVDFILNYQRLFFLLAFLEARTCPEGTLKCNSGQCISKDTYCAGTSGCRDGTQFPDVNCR